MTKRKRPQQVEFELQATIAEYLNRKYPSVLFTCERLSNIKLTIPQAVRLKRLNKTGARMPDFVILEPRGRFKGLCFEVKIADPFRRDGAIQAKYRDQAQTLDTLKEKGYRSAFVWTFEQTKELIDSYLG